MFDHDYIYMSGDIYDDIRPMQEIANYYKRERETLNV